MSGPRISRACGDGPQKVVEIGLVGVGALGVGLGAEILDDDFLDVAVRSCRSRIASSASMRSSRVSPMPIRMPVVNGTFSSPASRIVSSRTAGCLSGEPKCAPPFSHSRSLVDLQHDALADGDRAQAGDLLARHDAGIGVRQQAGLAQHQRRTSR